MKPSQITSSAPRVSSPGTQEDPIHWRMTKITEYSARSCVSRRYNNTNRQCNAWPGPVLVISFGGTKLKTNRRVKSRRGKKI